MDFPKVVIARETLRPPAFEKDVQHIEFRQDPLTGRRSRLNARRAGRIKPHQPTPPPSEVTGHREGCPFCPENIDRTVTKFDPAFYPGGRIRRGECCLFPNMFPLARHHAAATLCTTHFLDLHEFSAGMVADSLMAARQFLGLVREHDPTARYPMFHWNHLPSSAASVVHPHVQVLADTGPTSYQEVLLESSLRYHGHTGRSFWTDLIDEERQRGERYIGENGAAAALASFAPQGNREVQIILRQQSSLTDLRDDGIRDLAGCIVRVLAAYKAMGVHCFNLSTFSAAAGEKLEHYALHAKMISRPELQPFYRNDTGILERFHQEADIEVMPEAFAEAARRSWKE